MAIGACVGDRKAWIPLVLPILPGAIATIGWAVSNNTERNAPWVAMTAACCLVGWQVLLDFAVARTPRQWLLVVGAAAFRLPAMLLSAFIANMSGTGD